MISVSNGPRLEYLEAALQLFQLIMKFPLDFGSLACLVTDVNVHVCLGWGETPYRRSAGPHSSQILHL
jgi:hypothetical protein